MKPVKARITRMLPHCARLVACDNSGARILKVISISNTKTVKGRKPSGGIGDFIQASVVEGKQEMRKQVVAAIIVRQKKPIRRLDGTRIKFEDNAAVVVKDEMGNPKGTMIKGPIAKEVSERWPAVSKIASLIV